MQYDMDTSITICIIWYPKLTVIDVKNYSFKLKIDVYDNYKDIT